MILLTYGTRPEYIKIKPLIDIFNEKGFEFKTLFTGQHKDLLNDTTPDYSITIRETADNRHRLNSIISSILSSNFLTNCEEIPTHVLVQGDTTSAFAVALSAFNHKIKVIHLEAGLRSNDNENPYPEEANRRMISQISDINLCPTEYSANNLRNERILGKIFVVGNTVIDNLLKYRDDCKYTNKILVTLHRRENHEKLSEWFSMINKIAKTYPQYDFILPIHPNPNVQKHRGLLININVINPLSYDEMLKLLVKTRLVITDSGGLQEECSFFNKICLTCRTVTERPEAIGQSTIMIKSPEDLLEKFKIFVNDYKIDYICPFGDGNSAQKICEIIKNEDR